MYKKTYNITQRGILSQINLQNLTKDSYLDLKQENEDETKPSRNIRGSPDSRDKKRADRKESKFND